MVWNQSRNSSDNPALVNLKKETSSYCFFVTDLGSHLVQKF
uniref:Uncharacterized protein n=1 Tax=Tetranychus urticae TaxID=32264 RepID=T1L3M4_TETUR